METLEYGEPRGAEFEVGELKRIGEQAANGASDEGGHPEFSGEGLVEKEPTQNKAEESVAANLYQIEPKVVADNDVIVKGVALVFPLGT